MFIEPGKATFTNWSLSNGSLCFTTSCVCICSAFVEWPGMLFPNSRDIKLLQISAFHEYRLISLKIHKLTIYLSLLNEYSYEPLLLPMTRALMQIHSAAAAQLPALIPLISKEQTCPCVHDLNSQSLPLTLIHLIMLAAGALVEVCRRVQALTSAPGAPAGWLVVLLCLCSCTCR